MKIRLFARYQILLALVGFLSFANNFLYSQEYNHDDYELKIRRYGFGIGFNPFYITHNFDDLNNKLLLSGNEKISGNNLFTLGGAFYVYTGFVPNLRIGGFWSEAEKSSSKTHPAYLSGFDYRYSFWGISAEYAYPIAKRTSLVGGVMLGKGIQEYDLTKKYNSSIDWDALWASGNAQTIDYKLNLNSRFLIYSPFIMVEYSIWDFLAIRAGGGYMGSVKTDLNYETFYSVSGTPSSLRINNFYFQFGILTGLFMD